MILQSLCQYYERMRDDPDINIPEPGFSREKIRAEIVLNKKGELLYFNDLRVQSGKKSVPREMIVPQANKRSGSKAYEKPNFLWDSTAFVLCASNKDDNKASMKHEHFQELHKRLSQGTNDNDLHVVVSFLNHWSPEEAASLKNWDDLAGGNVVFRLDGERDYLHDKEGIVRIWLDHYNAREQGHQGYCLVSGLERPIARIHPDIKNVRNAQPKGASIVSFNDNAYESYGKNQNFNAPTSIDAAFAYTTALNYLMARDSRQKVQIGDASTVFWTKRESRLEGMLGMILDPKDVEAEDNKDVRLFLEAVRDGKRHEGIDPDMKFYILGISPNAARLAVRFWHVCSIGELEDRMGQHFRDLQIQRSFDSDPEFPGIRRILWETCNKKSKKETASPLLGGALMRSILEGTVYPQGLQNAVINRIRAEQALKDKNGKPVNNVNYVRAAILKAILVRKHRMYKQGMEVTMALDTENKNEAYLLGRLFAVLEKIQQEVSPGINTTIKDRFWGAASSTPKVVFPQILTLKNHHISKMDNPGRAVFFEKLIGGIMDKIESAGFPVHLTLDAQGLFVLGYYHQRQDFFKSRESQEANA